ncbi:MAG: NFACT family protein [Synergistaceae bacterium]|nr:NFACT family protein [Synergistaceae bacterium]
MKRVQKVDGGDSWITLTLSGGVVLLLSWGTQNCGAACITEKEKKALLSMSRQIPPITNALRSSIAGCEFIGAEQLRRDRIIRFSFRKTVGAGFTAVRCLTLEAMERYSNLILTDETGNILETAKHVHPSENRFRSILPNQPYVPPPVFDGISLEDWLAAPSLEKLKEIAGFGRTLLNALYDAGAGTAEKYLGNFYGKTVLEGMVPQMLGKYITMFPVLLDGAVFLENMSVEDIWRTITLSPLLDTSTALRRKKICDRLAHEIIRRERQICDINRLLHEEDPDKYRHYGELIVSNLWQIKSGTAEAEISYWDKDGNQKKTTVPLDPAIMPAQNAAAFFAKYRKITAAQERAAKLLGKVNQELNDLNEQVSIVSRIEDGESLSLIESEMGIAPKRHQPGNGKKKEAPLPPHRRFDLGFAIVFAGLSSKGNRYVTFRLAASDDLWFHVHGVPGSHVILRYTSAPTAEEEEDAIMFCSSLAAYFSKGRGNAGQRVDYTLRKHVSPIRGGEANVTYREFKSVTADTDHWKKRISG